MPGFLHVDEDAECEIYFFILYFKIKTRNTGEFIDEVLSPSGSVCLNREAFVLIYGIEMSNLDAVQMYRS